MPANNAEGYSIEKNSDNLGGWQWLFKLPVKFLFPVSGAAGSGMNSIYGETPVGTIDGVNRTFTLSQAPALDSAGNPCIAVFSDNARVKPSQYTVTGTQLVFAANSPYIPQSELVADLRW